MPIDVLAAAFLIALFRSSLQCVTQPREITTFPQVLWKNVVQIGCAFVARLFEVNTYSTLHTRAAWLRTLVARLVITLRKEY